MVARNSEGGLVHRPLSPHLQAYRPQITSVLSIVHRLTGVANAVGALLLVWWLIAAALGPDAYAGVQAFVASPVGLVFLFGWTVSLFFHFFNGIRHLAWDVGYGFDKPHYAHTGYAVLIATIACTLLAWAAGLFVWLHQ
jgi:succinate dehydrogenase / fumarate reductase, cytochrome b subunit